MLGVAVICELLKRRSWSDVQCGYFVVLEGEVVTELNRTSGKSAADLGGHNYFVAQLREIGYVSGRFVFRSGTVYPPLDCSASIFVRLIRYEGVARKEGIEVIRLASIVRLEKGGNGRR